MVLWSFETVTVQYDDEVGEVCRQKQLADFIITLSQSETAFCR